MDKNQIFTRMLKELRGKTIAIVYIFEGENAPGFEHYWIWKSDIISGWLKAVQELECVPFILDVRTFIQKAINNSLPQVDFVLNLNCGSCELYSMCLVPSMCSFLKIPCIPCDACAIVMGENKRISNLIASAMNIPVPQTFTESSKNGIYRPLNLGNSKGIQIGHYSDIDKITGTYQEFIPGYDITIPIVYNPLIGDIDLLPALVYFPNSKDPTWIYDEEEKESYDNFEFLPVIDIEDKCKKQLIKFAKEFPIRTFGRIDARIKCTDEKLTKKITEHPLSLENFFFIEINGMPTIEAADSFEIAFDVAKSHIQHNLYSCINSYVNFIENPSINGFLLSCSMLAFIKAKY